MTGYARKRPWSVEEEQEARRRLASGELMKDIADALDRSFDSVAGKLRDFAKELKAARFVAGLGAPLPDTFAGLLKLFPQYADAAQWMGVERRTAKSMAGRDWVPRRCWAGLTRGLERQCDTTLPDGHLEAMAAKRERWERAAPQPRDWSNLPALERSIARIVASKVRVRHLADEAAGYAILEMMEYAQPHLGYGVKCAFNYLREQHNAAVRVRCLSDDELHQALDVRMFTPANQIYRLQVNEIVQMGSSLPPPYDRVFLSLCMGESNEEIARRFKVAESTAASYKAHCRNLLREYSLLSEPDEDDFDDPRALCAQSPEGESSVFVVRAGAAAEDRTPDLSLTKDEADNA